MELRAGSIVLRPWREEDAPAVYAACQDPEIQHWMPVIPRPYTRDDALAFVTGGVDLGPHQFAIVEDGHVVGSIGMVVDDDSNRGQIGYWCAAHARGRGITSRALRRLCEHALDELGVQRLELITDPDNRCSQQADCRAQPTVESAAMSNPLALDVERCIADEQRLGRRPKNRVYQSMLASRSDTGTPA